MSLTKIGSIGINTGIQLAGVTTVSTLKVGSGVTMSSDGDVFTTGITTFSDDVNITGGGDLNMSGGNGKLRITSSIGNLGILSSTTNDNTFDLFDDDTQTRFRTVDGRLHISADHRNEVADSELRFMVDGTNQAAIDGNGHFFFNNDTDTYIHRPLGNHLAVVTQDSERVRIESGGNVGVGTSNASSLLHVHGSGGGTSGLKVSNAFDNVIHYFQNDNDNSNYIISYAGTGSPEIELKSNGFVSINGTGKKGVGVGVGASHRDAAFTVAANVAGVSTALAIINENGASTGTEIVTNKNLILSADSGDDSGTPNSNIIFKVDAEEKVRIESNGRLLVGSNALRNVGGDNSSGQLQIEGTGGNNSSMQLVRNSADTGSSFIRFGKTRGTSTGAVTTVADGDHLGHITFHGADGTDVNNTVAHIRATVNGTVAENQIPTDLVFETSATNGNSRAERLRIKSDGNVGINQSTPTAKLQVTGGGAYTGANSGRSVEGIDIQSSSGDVDGAFGGAISFGVGNVGRSAIAAVQNNADDDNTGLAFFTHPSNTGSADAEEKVRITSAGAIGIGTVTPSNDIQLVNDSATVKLTSTGSGNSTRLILVSEADTYGGVHFGDPSDEDAGRIRYYHGGSAPNHMAFSTGAVERLRITSNGHVLIGGTDEVVDTKVRIDGNIAQGNTSTGTGAIIKTIVVARSYDMSTSATNILTFDNWGTGAMDITVFRRDNTSPAGAQVVKLYLAFHGSGTNITQASIAQENKVLRGSIHNIDYSISENNNTATLIATGDDNGGETQDLTFHILARGHFSGTVAVV